MEIRMQIAQSYQYRGISVAITVDQLKETGTISYLNTIKLVKTMDINLLKRVVQTMIDKEVDGNLYHNSA
jgi:hypothetical protein